MLLRRIQYAEVALNKHSKLVVLSLFIAALVLRLGWIGLNNGCFSAGDTPTYVNIALNIAEGNGYVQENGEPTAFVVPLYPCFLAVIFRLVGENILFVEVIQAILGGLTVVAVYLLTKYIFDLTTGIFAGLATCFHPWLIFWTGYILTDTVFVLLLVLSVLSFVRLLAEPRNIRAAWAGIILGLTSLARPVGFGLSLIVLVYAAWRLLLTKRVKRWALFGIYLLSFVLIFSPWVIHNYFSLHRVVLVSTNGDPLYRANNLSVKTYLGKATGQGQSEHYELPKSVQSLGNEAAREAALRSAAFQFIWQHPAEFAHRALIRLYLFWSPTFPTYTFNHNLYNSFFYLPLYAAALVGLFLLARKKQWAYVWLFIMIFGYFSLIHAATIVDWDQRYRLPLQPFLCVFAAAGGLYLLRILLRFFLKGKVKSG